MVRHSHELEFHVSDERGTATTIFSNFDKAAGFAITRSGSSGVTMQIDVITWSRAAAKKWGGESSVEIYEEDPDTSVHERILVKAESLGHVR
jgi:hypothetical protein